MSKVKNHRAINLLALRELKTSRRMNFVLIISVILTCVMFTCIANIGGNIIIGFQKQTMRMVGGDRMAGIKYVLPEDYEKIQADSKTKDVVWRSIVGNAVNDDFQSIRVEVNCAGNDNAAKACFGQPTTGRLPEKLEEIAVSSLVLDELGLPKELGITVPLTLDIDGQTHGFDFTLCGFWEGDRISMMQLGWVSRAFADIYAPTPTEPFMRQSDGIKYAGYWQVDFNFGNSFNIEGKLDALLYRIYEDEDLFPDMGVNWAYAMNSLQNNYETMAGLLVLAILVFLAGYLIIYNIFQLNITANIQKYGLLKTIGVTPKQIHRLVRFQANVYALIGIPVGLLIGSLAGKILFRYVQPGLSLNPDFMDGIGFSAMMLICLIAALFSYATVMLSAEKPAKIAGKVSPIEALRFSETRISTKKDKRKIRKVTPFSIARSNMIKSRKKTVIVVLSLTLSLVLFNTVVTVFRGLDMDKLLEFFMVGDFEILSDQNGRNASKPKITSQTRQYVSELNGVKECNAVYYVDAELLLAGNSMERARKLFETHGNAQKWEKIVEGGEFNYSRELDQYLTLRNLAQGTPYIEAGLVHSDLYGVSTGLLEHLNVIKGTIDEEKFLTGNYALVYTDLIFLDEDDPANDLCDVGDTFTLRVGDKKKEYEVMAVCDIPYALSTKIYLGLYGHVILPESEFQFFSEGTNALDLMIMADDGKYDLVAEALKDLASDKSKGIELKTKQDYLDDYRGLQQMFMVVGGALTIILAIIGILNFINAVVTGMISRRKEFIVMQAVGMTGKQVKEMLTWEGVTYVFWTFLGSAGIGVGLAYFVLKRLERESAFFTYHFTIMPLLICIPILLALAIVVPLISFRLIARGNTVNTISLE